MHLLRSSRFAACTIAITIVAASTEAAMLDLGTLGGTSSRATDINESGQVVGCSETTGGETHPFLYSNGVMTDLGTFGGTYSCAHRINESGQVVGTSETTGGETHAFLYSAGVMTDLGTLGGTSSSPTDINNAGQVVGISPVGGIFHTFLYSAGVMTDLGTLGGYFPPLGTIPGDVNDAGQVVGVSMGWESEIHGFLYSGGVMTDLNTLTGTYTEPWAINDAGEIVGGAEFGGDYHAALLIGGTLTDLGALGWNSSLATCVNEAGQITGVLYNTSGSTGHAFLYSNGVMTDLGVPSGASATRIEPSDINEAGQVVGYWYETGGTYQERRAFLYSNGVMTDLGTLGGAYSEARALNDTGQLVGVSETTGGEEHAFIEFICRPAPATSCLTGPKSSIQIKDRADDAKDQLKWKWSAGGEVTQGDLGDPQNTTTYTLCIYDSVASVDRLVGSLEIDPKPFWQDKAPKGWLYDDETSSEDGVRKVQLKTGAAGKTKVQLKAAGVGIPMFTPASAEKLLQQDSRVTVQLFNNETSRCWTSEFPLAGTKKNDGEQFSAKVP